MGTRITMLVVWESVTALDQGRIIGLYIFRDKVHLCIVDVLPNPSDWHRHVNFEQDDSQSQA